MSGSSHLTNAREICDSLSRPLQRALDLICKGDPDRDRPELHNRVQQLIDDLEALNAEFQS